MSISIARTNSATVLRNVPRDISEIERQTSGPQGIAQFFARVLSFCFK